MQAAITRLSLVIIEYVYRHRSICRRSDRASFNYARHEIDRFVLLRRNAWAMRPQAAARDRRTAPHEDPSVRVRKLAETGAHLTLDDQNRLVVEEPMPHHRTARTPNECYQVRSLPSFRTHPARLLRGEPSTLIRFPRESIAHASIYHVIFVG